MNHFDWKQYLSNYPDLKQAGINNHKQTWKHYVSFGKSERRTDRISPEKSLSCYCCNCKIRI